LPEKLCDLIVYPAVQQLRTLESCGKSVVWEQRLLTMAQGFS
jgi:hypothetical protein